MGIKLDYLEEQKSGIYRFRRKLPLDVRDVFGKKEHKQSLRTKDETLALERWKIVDTEIKQLIQQARSGKIIRSKLTDKAIEAVAHNSARQQLVDDLDVRGKGYEVLPDAERFPYFDPFAPIEEQQALTTPMSAVAQQAANAHFLISKLEQALALDDFASLPETVANRIATNLKVQGHKGKIDDKIYRAFVAAEIEAQKGIISRCEGQSIATPALIPVNKHLLSKEAKKWSALKLKTTKWKDKTSESFLAAVRLFIEAHGDKDISEYIKDDARKFQAILIAFPANAKKNPDLEGLTPQQVVKLGLPPMSTNNAHKIFNFVSSFFRYAAKSYDTMKSNPFDGQSIEKEDNTDSRKPYTVEELNTVFGSPLYHGVKSKIYCNRAGDVSMRETGKFWLPLISLFTGMRMNEIAQIHREDIRHESGFLIFDLCKGEGKDFKTKKSSVRHIPVHFELLKCGLLQVRDSGKSTRLFPEMKRGKDGTFSYNYSKWYARFLNNLGIKRPDLVFHSFRHLFEEACMNTGMQDSMVDILQGHKLDKMKAHYVDKIDLQMKNEFVQKIKYEGLDLSHIFV